MSTVLEAAGLAVIAVGVTAGVWVLTSLGWALIAGGVVGGSVLVFLGFALSLPEPLKPKRITIHTSDGALTNGQVEQI
jgi:predicted MFS family arabinose efflux permease